ncbi:hypothetical protein L2E34_25720, partial [Salmonella enterica subsp. enterica serovar Weltevreden]|nr:hypothetical protein [Salmonella enterica subsp. enterica serovar Weltevreden]
MDFMLTMGIRYDVAEVLYYRTIRDEEHSARPGAFHRYSKRMSTLAVPWLCVAVISASSICWGGHSARMSGRGSTRP